MNSEWSPVDTDRRLARAHDQWRSWRRRLSEQADPDDEPLAGFRIVTGLSLFRELDELPATDPLREPLRRWVYRLAEQRINHGALVALASAAQRKRELPDAPVRGAISLDGLLARAIEDAPRREPWTRLYLSQARFISAESVLLWQRRREVARRMRIDDPAQIEAPADNVRAVAAEVAAATRDRIRELRLPSLAAFIERALGRDVPGDWPARLTPQRMLDFFRDGDLLRSLELRPRPLPSSVGAASTARALAILGGAWHEALAPRDQPFVVAHDPYGARRHEAAALFAQLLLSRRFLARHFDISARLLPDVERRMAELWLFELARAAFRARVRPAALESERAFRETYAELAARDLNLSLSPAAAGSLFRLGIEDEQRLTGQLLAAARRRALIDAHDEDWFRNPRAIEQLRAEARLPPEVKVPPERLEKALRASLAELTALLR